MSAYHKIKFASNHLNVHEFVGVRLSHNLKWRMYVELLFLIRWGERLLRDEHWNSVYLRTIPYLKEVSDRLELAEFTRQENLYKPMTGEPLAQQERQEEPRWLDAQLNAQLVLSGDVRIFSPSFFGLLK